MNLKTIANFQDSSKIIFVPNSDEKSFFQDLLTKLGIDKPSLLSNFIKCNFKECFVHVFKDPWISRQWPQIKIETHSGIDEHGKFVCF